MRRLVVAAILAAGAAGCCSVCQSPFDYCGPVRKGRYPSGSAYRGYGVAPQSQAVYAESPPVYESAPGSVYEASPSPEDGSPPATEGSGTR